MLWRTPHNAVGSLKFFGVLRRNNMANRKRKADSQTTFGGNVFVANYGNKNLVNSASDSNRMEFTFRPTEHKTVDNSVCIRTGRLKILSAPLYSFVLLLIFFMCLPKEAMAQAVEIPTGRYFMHFGKNDIVGNSSGNFAIHFGKGPLSDNQGLYAIGIQENDLQIGSVPNLSSQFSQRTLTVTQNAGGIVAIRFWAPVSAVPGGYTTANEVRLDVNGRIRAWNVAVTSDRRYKQEIKPISNLDNLFKVNSVQFKSSSETAKQDLEQFIQTNKGKIESEEFNAGVSHFEQLITERDADTRTYFGFIAQELREVYPNLVFEDERGFLSVDYIGMIPVLVEAIKELNQKVEKLKGKGFEKTTATVISTAKLYQNNPNPFNENTEIKYYVPEDASEAMICIYDLTGSQIVRFDLRQKGYSSLTVRGRELKAGMYIYALLVDGKEIDSKRMILTDK